MRKLLIVALLLTLLVPMVIETSFAQETEVAPSSDRIFKRTYEHYKNRSDIKPSFVYSVVSQNKLYRGTVYKESVDPVTGGFLVIYGGYLNFTGIYQYSDVTLY